MSMLQVTPHVRVLVAKQVIDFRKGIDGIARLCKEILEEDPFSGTLFIFRNRRQTSIKVLVYDGQGFWLCQKRLSQGRFKFWPEDPLSYSKEVEALDLHILLSAGHPGQSQAPMSWKRIKG